MSSSLKPNRYIVLLRNLRQVWLAPRLFHHTRSDHGIHAGRSTRCPLDDGFADAICIDLLRGSSRRPIGPSSRDCVLIGAKHRPGRRSPRFALRAQSGSEGSCATSGERRRPSHRERCAGRGRIQVAARGRPRFLSHPAAALSRPGNGQSLLYFFDSTFPRSAASPEQDPSALGLAAAGNPRLNRGVIAAAPNGTWQVGAALRTGPDHLWQRRRKTLRSIEERRWLCGNGQRVPVVPIHLPRKTAASWSTSC